MAAGTDAIWNELHQLAAQRAVMEDFDARLAAFRQAQAAEDQASRAYEAAIGGSAEQYEAARATFKAACAVTRVRLRELAAALEIE